MPTLHEMQRDFATSILGGSATELEGAVVEDGIFAGDRLRIYRNTVRTVLTESLRLSYPCVDRLVGPDFFDMAGAKFVRAHPPRSAYLNHYGGAFPAFLEELPGVAGFAYLPDVARFEWALSLAANAEDTPALDALGLAGIDPADHTNVRFEPHPSVHLLSLRYPADAIADAVLGHDDQGMAEVDVQSGPVFLVVHRGPEGVQAERLSQDHHGLLARLFSGEKLGRVLEGAGPDAASLLAEQFTRGRLNSWKIDRDSKQETAGA